MNNILLVSHDGLASGLKKAAELILGEQTNIDVLELTADEGIESFKQALHTKISTLMETKNSLVILSDLKNGTPYNCTFSIVTTENLWDSVFLLSGMNLNLLLETMMTNDLVLTEQLTGEIILSAQKGITEMNKSILTAQLNASEE